MKLKGLLPLALCISGVAAQAQITPGFEPGNLSVLRVGDKQSTLASSGDPLFLDEYTTTGVLTNSIAIPTSGPTSLIIGGTSSSEGAISRSANSNFIVIAGYNTDYPYTSSLSGAASTAVPRASRRLISTAILLSSQIRRRLSAETTSAAPPRMGRIIFGRLARSAARFTWGWHRRPATIQSMVADSEVAQYFQRQSLLFVPEINAGRHLLLRGLADGAGHDKFDLSRRAAHPALMRLPSARTTRWRTWRTGGRFPRAAASSNSSTTGHGAWLTPSPRARPMGRAASR